MLRRTVLAGLMLPAACRADFKDWFRAADPDVIVVGAGGAGLAAAVSAAQQGASVLVLEKMPYIGGNTLISGGFLGVVDPARQSPLGIKDSAQRHFADIFDNGGRKADPELVRTLVKESPAMLAWLEKLGVQFRPEVIEIYGSHFPRSHIPVPSIGSAYIRALSAAAVRLKVEIRTSSAVSALFLEEGRVAGVSYEDAGGSHEVRAARGIILAAGGFGRNVQMVARYAPRLADSTCDNAAGSTGEVLEAARKIGAAVTGMEYIQCLPGLCKGGKIRTRLHSDVTRFILVDARGRRFVDETSRRDVLTEKVLALPERVAYCIADSEGLSLYDPIIQRDVIRAVETGDAFRGNTLAELAGRIGVDPQTFEEAVCEYNASLGPGSRRRPIVKPPFWAGRIGMTVHSTMGGIRINSRAQCLNAKGLPIPGLFAAGEITGGIHGTNRIGANGTCDALTFGRIAGRSAAQETAR